jgi:hypothetical protein
VLKSAGGDVCNHHGMTEDELNRANIPTGTATDPQIASAATVGRKRFKAALFLAKSDQARHGPLSQELANDFNKGRDSCPESLTAACELMLHDVRSPNTRPQPGGDNGMAFNTVAGEGVPGSNTQANPRPDVTCNKCGKVGHFSNKCAETKHANGAVSVNAGMGEAPPNNVSVLGNGGTASAAPPANSVAMTLLGTDVGNSVCSFQFMVNGTLDQNATAHLLSQHEAMTGQTVPTSWILLENQSTVDVFCNKDLLQNVREGTTTCRISCTAGTAETKLIRDLLGHLTPAWCHPTGIANVLLSHRVSKHCRAEHDSSKDGATFNVTKQDGSVLHFHPSLSGLHFYDSQEHGTTLINAVAENKTKHAARQFKQAAAARRLQNVIGPPSA